MTCAHRSIYPTPMNAWLESQKEEKIKISLTRFAGAIISDINQDIKNGELNYKKAEERTKALIRKTVKEIINKGI